MFRKQREGGINSSIDIERLEAIQIRLNEAELIVQGYTEID